MIRPTKLLIINLMISIATLFACTSNSEKELSGVWFTIDSTNIIRNYSEIHISDSNIVVYDSEGLNYSSLYTRDKDTIIMYYRDIFSNWQIRDSTPTKFIYKIENDALQLINCEYPNHTSSWQKLRSVQVFIMTLSNDPKDFILRFGERYKKYFLEKYRQDEIDQYLYFYHKNWNEILRLDEHEEQE